MIKSLSTIVLCGCLITACSGSHKATQLSQAGYSEIRSHQNQFVIDFTGAGMTSIEKVEEYALMRAAEATLAHGYNYFRVERKQDLSKKKSIKSVSGNDLAEFSLFQAEKKRKSIEEVSPSVRLYIKCYKDDPRLFDIIEAGEFLKIHKKT